MNCKSLMVKPGSRVKLANHDAGATHGYNKAKALLDLAKYQSRMFELQEVLYAERKHALLIVLQAIDAGGKDGTIRTVMSGVNPQGCSVTSFKKPSAEDLEHDFLWRVHKAIPGKGQIGIFNRSHYEDVLIVRVHDLAPKSLWSKRYAHINDFERVLTDHGVTILKFFLHISKDEQRKRFEDRLAERDKLWKVNPIDFEERKKWDDYVAAFEDAMTKCSSKWAPWYIIPSNKKWFRNMVISRIVVEALEAMKLEYPQPHFDPKTVEIV